MPKQTKEELSRHKKLSDAQKARYTKNREELAAKDEEIAQLRQALTGMNEQMERVTNQVNAMDTRSIEMIVSQFTQTMRSRKPAVQNIILKLFISELREHAKSHSDCAGEVARNAYKAVDDFEAALKS